MQSSLEIAFIAEISRLAPRPQHYGSSTLGRFISSTGGDNSGRDAPSPCCASTHPHCARPGGGCCDRRGARFTNSYPVCPHRLRLASGRGAHPSAWPCRCGAGGRHRARWLERQHGRCLSRPGGPALGVGLTREWCDGRVSPPRVRVGGVREAARSRTLTRSVLSARRCGLALRTLERVGVSPPCERPHTLPSFRCCWMLAMSATRCSVPMTRAHFTSMPTMRTSWVSATGRLSMALSSVGAGSDGLSTAIAARLFSHLECREGGSVREPRCTSATLGDES